MKNTTIQFYIKEVYGLETSYVADAKLAGIISTLTGRKTLLESDFEALKALGFTFEQVLKPAKK